MYRYLLIDNDDTLMDFHLAEQHALGDTLRRHGIPDSEDILSQYHAINQALWKALERGETTQAKLKVERFRQLLAALLRAAHQDRENRGVSLYADLNPY